MLCLEQLGVKLPAGHTYVQIHERGNIELESRGHKVKKVTPKIGRVGLAV